MINYILKKLPTDFQVQEVTNFISKPNKLGKFQYYLITKAGYTTFQAVAMIEKHFSLPAQSINYSGLKDEDALTFQYVSSAVYLDASMIATFNEHHYNNDNHFVSLQYYGSGDESFKVAKLIGNCFRLRVRNLGENFTFNLATQKEHTLFFINYYGGQRFGLPNQLKNTHLIGKALINEQYDLALTELLKQQSEIQEQACDYKTQPEMFFAQLNKSQIAFYQNAYYSYLWNKEISDYLGQQQFSTIQRSVDGVEYEFFQTEGDILELLRNRPLIENIRVVFEKNAFDKVIYQRPTVVQIKILIEKIMIDELNPDHFSCDLSFFLPSGCYATMAVAQFLEIVSSMQPTDVQSNAILT